MEIPVTVQKPIRYERRRQRLDGADFEPQGYFLLRTPLLAVDELEEWSAVLQAPAAAGDPAKLVKAIEADRKAQRQWLRDLLTRPAVLEALHLATPALLEALEEWRRHPDGKKGRRAEEALVRYAFRMAARATPFGTFAACTAGRVHAGVDEGNRLMLAPQASYRRHSRLDMGYLFSLAGELNEDRELRRSLRYRPNTSIYRAGGRLRYAEARLNGPHINYHLVAVEPDEFLEAALARAADGATPDEIAAVVAASDPDGEITLDAAAGYVTELIDSQLLTSDLWPALTGPEAVHGLIETLEGLPSPKAAAAAATLRGAREALEQLDRNGLGNDPDRYSEIARRLEPLPQRSERQHLFQVDLFKPGQVSLAPAVLDEVARGLEALHRLHTPILGDSLDGFRERFIDRYGTDRLVPFLEALDVEVGAGQPLSAMGGDTSPLLDGLDFSSEDDVEKVRWGKREQLLLRKLMEATAAGAFEIVIDDDDLAGLETPTRPPLPDSFQAMAILGTTGEEALAAGDFLVWVRTAFGPSGARLAGRFCHADAEIADLVSEQLRAEEALDPDAVFAEVVHVAPGRVGNVGSRPVLRDWEIPYLGVSGAPRERQIPLDDLLVTVEGEEVVLYSARLRRRVLPRLTTAHNFVLGNLAAYRILCSLQPQGMRSGLQWTWHPFQKQPFLPRVRCGRAILSRACWRVTAEEIEDLAARRDADRYAAMQRWRQQRGIPRRVLLAELESDLLVDFDHVLSVDAFVGAARQIDGAFELSEFWPSFEELPVRGPEGRFVHELTIPFTRHRAPVKRAPAPPVHREVERIFPPTSRWLYLNLYAGSATADLVLRDAIAPLVARAMESGAAERWFFIRYNDPQNHLRVRFGGEPARLREIIDWLPELLDPLLAEGRISKWQLDTYEREVERYGGPEGMEIAERIFHADSEAVLSIVEDLAGDRGADWRWRAALVGIDRLLADFGFDLPARRDVLSRLRRSFGNEFAAGPQLTQQLAQRLRETGTELYDLVTTGVGPDHPLAGSIAAFDRRSAKLAPLVAELRALELRGDLTVLLDGLVSSYIHMFVNRLIRSDARRHELVLYDLLHRLTVSRLARLSAVHPERSEGSPVIPR
jgi:class I lanthipeptide synthase